MATITSGVYPVFDNVFKIGTAGRDSTDSDMATIADATSFSVSIDGDVEEWTPMTLEGRKRRMVTGKGFSISISGKRHVGDTGNDYVAGKMFATGTDSETVFEWIMPNGTTIKFDCVINITSGGGDSTNVEGLEFEVLSDGKPTVTTAA